MTDLLRDVTAFPQRTAVATVGAIFHAPPSADASGSVRDTEDGVNGRGRRVWKRRTCVDGQRFCPG
jgi:hypothetical protein